MPGKFGRHLWLRWSAVGTGDRAGREWRRGRRKRRFDRGWRLRLATAHSPRCCVALRSDETGWPWRCSWVERRWGGIRPSGRESARHRSGMDRSYLMEHTKKGTKCDYVGHMINNVNHLFQNKFIIVSSFLNYTIAVGFSPKTTMANLPTSISENYWFLKWIRK